MKRDDADKIKQSINGLDIDATVKADLIIYIEEQVDDAEKIPFEEFWKPYPKKVGLKVCKERWTKTNAKKQKMAIHYLRNYLMRAGDYVNDPINYLKREMYMDFYYEAMARQNTTKEQLYKQ
jgi:hypothetical protein